MVQSMVSWIQNRKAEWEGLGERKLLTAWSDDRKTETRKESGKKTYPPGYTQGLTSSHQTLCNNSKTVVLLG